MPQYLTPGVYVEEIMGGARPIEGVGTNVAAFVGSLGTDVNAGVPVAVNNWTQYTTLFQVSGPSTPLTLAVHGFFLNGGQRCYVLNIGDGPITGTASRPGLSVLEEIDEIAIVGAPGMTDARSYDAVLSHCELMRDRVAVLDSPDGVTDLNELTRPATASDSAPPPDTPAPAEGEGEGAPPPPKPTGRTPRGGAPRASDYGAAYFPRIKVADPITGALVTAPPSGHVAGVWARTDATRGVHKAPANETLRGALDLTYALTPAEQGLLNTNGINAIRLIGGSIKVWGARTRSDNPEWRYLPVRRLFTFAEQSILRGTNWMVFEPNDQLLWAQMKRDTRAFLRRLWRDGALFGATEREAFFVKCDAETNPQENIDAGIVTALIGMAPVKPAEFIVFKVSQYAPGAADGGE